MDDFTTAYIETALWSSTGDNDRPLDDDFSPDDLAPEALAKIEKDCAAFQETPAWLAAIEADAFNPCRATGCSTESRGGHDFWLTRNRHGAGYWDGEWSEPHGKALTDIAHSFGEVDLYAGDDGRLYL